MLHDGWVNLRGLEHANVPEAPFCLVFVRGDCGLAASLGLLIMSLLPTAQHPTV